MKILVRPFPLPNESAQGYIVRLTESNRLDYPRWLLSLAGAKDQKDPARSTLARVSCHTEEMLCVLRGPVSNLSRLNRQDSAGLSMRFWNTQQPRYCARCLAQSAHWRSAWDIVFLTVCPHHGNELIDTCFACGHALRWNRKSLTSCLCGADLRDATSHEGDPRSRRLSALIAKHLGGSESVDDVPKELHSLSLEQLLRLIWLLGAYGVMSRRAPQKIMGLATLEVTVPLVRSAALALLAWPVGFHELLNRIAASYRMGNKSNCLSKGFGRFYPSLYNTFPEPAFDFLREAFEAYVAARWEGQLARRNRRLSDALLAEHEWIPTKQAAQILAVSIPTARGFVERGLLIGRLKPTDKGRVMGSISKPSLEKLLADRRHWVTLKTVRSKYGLSRRTAHALIEEGVLNPLSGPGLDGRPVWLFDDRELEKLNLLIEDKVMLHTAS